MTAAGASPSERRFVVHEPVLERALENQRRIDLVLKLHYEADNHCQDCEWRWPCPTVQILTTGSITGPHAG